jgi:hypothetical protein
MCKWVKTLEQSFSSEEVPDEVKAMFLPSGKDSGLEGCETVFQWGNEETVGSMVVCLVPHFHQLQQISQEVGIPVPMLSQGTLEKMKKDPDVKAGVSSLSDWKTAGKSAEEICRCFESLAKYIIVASRTCF